jgi:heme/copper-type cytochrome/quinol oxidase subunit 1
MFIVNGTREFTKRFTRRPQNIFLIFICFLSIAISFIFAGFYKPISVFANHNWTIYPPLSASGELNPPQNFDKYLYLLLAFIAIQILVLGVTVRQVFKK